MPEQLKGASNSPEFEKYLKTFIKKKERQHRLKVVQEIATSVSLMLAD